VHGVSDTDDTCEPVPPRMSRIGLVAYCALPPLSVFVRVPNEPGRWMITHRCVVEVDCTYCKAIVGEPCHNMKLVKRYRNGTHTYRRAAFSARYRMNELGQHKPKIPLQDIEAAQSFEPSAELA
jgi:hypothetical protein